MTTLLDLPRARVNRERIAKAVVADMRRQLVGRIVKDHHPGVDAESAADILDDTLEFLLRCADEPGQVHTPSRSADIGWHVFLLFTRPYAAFCERHAGRFIHHSPTDRAQKVESAEP